MTQQKVITLGASAATIIVRMVQAGNVKPPTGAIKPEEWALALAEAATAFQTRVANCGLKGRMLPMAVIAKLSEEQQEDIVDRLRKHARRLMFQLTLRKGWIYGGRSVNGKHSAGFRANRLGEETGWQRGIARKQRGAMFLYGLANRIENKTF